MPANRVHERTDCLQTLIKVGREFNAAIDPQRVLQIALGESLRVTGFSCGYAALLELGPARDATYSEQITEGCPSTHTGNIELDLEVVQSQQLRLIPDLSKASIPSSHAGIQAVLVAPFSHQSGVIHLHSTEPVAVDQNIIEFMEGLTAQVSVALASAQRYQNLLAQNDRLDHRTRQVVQMAQVGRVIRSDQSFEEILQDLVYVLQESVGFDIVLLSLVDGDGAKRVLRRVAAAGLPPAVWEKLKQVDQPYARIAELLRDEFRIGNAYLIPEQRQDIYTSGLYTYAALENTQVLEPQDWHAGDLFLIPLQAANGEVLGILSLDNPRNKLRPTAKAIGLIKVLVSQAAISIEKARLYEAVRGFTTELEQRVERRTRDLARERDQVSALLRITTELATSLDLDRVLHRALELVSEAVGATQGSILLLDQITGELTYKAALGWSQPLPPEGKRLPSERREGLIGWVIQHQQPTIVADTQTDERWVPLPELGEGHRSVLSAPLFTGEDVWGVLMLFNPAPDAFSEAQLQLVETAAAQVSPSIYNAELYKLIREQSEQLGSMMRSEREETAKTVAMLESVADGVMVVNVEGQVILFNAAAERIFELDRQQIVGEPISKFISLWGKVGEIWGEAVKEWTRLPDAAQEKQFLQDRLELGEKVISVHLAPVIYTTRGLPGFLGTVSVFRDITRDVELDRMQREWVSTVSHELRTPMTSIKGYADLLMLGAAGPVSDAQQNFLNIIKSNADRLSVLVNDLLDISRIETGRMKLDLKPIDLYGLVETVENNLRGRREQEGKVIGFQARLPEGLPPVYGDIDRATQILTNLLDNAFNYTPDSGDITISAQVNTAGQHVQIDITDTGIGISPKDQAKILDRFYRSDHPDVQRISGTGLGLAIVHHLIEMHGGQLSIYSEGLGTGSTFSFTIPIAQEESIAGKQDG